MRARYFFLAGAAAVICILCVLGAAPPSAKFPAISLGGTTNIISGNRTAANASALYKANSGTAFTSIGTNTSTGGTGTRPTLTVTAFALNFGGGPIGFSPRRLSFAALHDGLASTETEALYNAAQAMRTALGDGYV